MKPKKPKRNPNADRLDDIYLAWLRLGAEAPTFGEYASRRGVLAVCAKTVPNDVVYAVAEDLRPFLRRLARGAK